MGLVNNGQTGVAVRTLYECLPYFSSLKEVHLRRSMNVLDSMILWLRNFTIKHGDAWAILNASWSWFEPWVFLVTWMVWIRKMMALNLSLLQMDCPMSKPSASISVGVLWTWDQLKWSPMYWCSQIRRNTSSSWNKHLLELRLWIASSIGKFKWPQLLAFELLWVCGEISSKPPEKCEFYPHLPNLSVSLCFLFETLLSIFFYL